MKTYYEALQFEQCGNGTSIEWNGSPGKDLRIYGNVVYDKSDISNEIMEILINGTVTTGCPFGIKDKIRSISHKIHKNKLQMF